MNKPLLPPTQRPAAPAAKAHRRGLDRRGAIGAAFAVGVVAVLGMGALATEGGLWYMARRNAQTAADAGALAGAMVIGFRGNDTAGRTAGEQAAISVVARNGFATGVNGGTVTATATGVRISVTVSQTQFIGLARLITNTPPTARAVADAEIFDTGPACMLSLRGRTTITGSNVTSASDCLIASNSLDSRSVEFGGNAAVNAYSVRAMGDCYGCPPANTNVTLERPPLTNATIPMSDPYRALQDPNLIPDLGTWSGNNRPAECQNPNTYTTTTTTGTGQNRVTTTSFTPTSWNAAIGGRIAICEDINLSAGETLNLSSGTYLFYNANLFVSGGTVNCTSCTFVFSGPTSGTGQNGMGTMRVSSDSTVNLTAPTAGPWQDPRLEGIAVYRDYRSNAGNEKNNLNNQPRTNTIKVAGGANVNIAGAIYAPTSQVEYEGNSSNSSSASRCVSIVASTIQVGGNTALNVEGCADYGTNLAQDRVVRLTR